MFNQLYYVFRPPRFTVIPDAREVIGILSQEKRQIDVAVFDCADTFRPFLAVESKCYKRKLNIKDIETFIGMVQDLGALNAMMVCPYGLSKAAHRRAEAAKLIIRTLTFLEADRLNWREVARMIFPWDETLHPIMGDALYAFERSPDVWDWIDVLEELPFEEWETTITSYSQMDAPKCEHMLRTIAQHHWSDGWRFNSVRLLEAFGWLDDIFRDFLLQGEADSATIELLQSFR